MARPAQDRAEEILDAARAQLRLDGAGQTTVDAVAARAGVGKGTVFLYWPTKTRLLNAVLSLEKARLLAELADDLRTGAVYLSAAHVVRREISAFVNNPDLAPYWLDLPGPSADPDSFPGRALRRIIPVMQARGLVQDHGIDEIATGFETVMSGAVRLGLAEPSRKEVLLDAAEHLIAAAYDRAEASSSDVARALPEVIELLEDAVDELVVNAVPDRPTTAVLRPRERPAPLDAVVESVIRQP
ncbi:TetR/AcrR family transcriptional regulator [Promicromonospora vindobonensis]|uniref:TetR/AcrR family transcriptional regulator n=1 Tax=Promicromonospora vindobonensis TaxID=195748 RepID=A0ABW5VXV2_9MICO